MIFDFCRPQVGIDHVLYPVQFHPMCGANRPIFVGAGREDLVNAGHLEHHLVHHLQLFR